MSAKLKRVAVAGSTGYSGQEICALLKRHPHFSLDALVGRDNKPEEFKNKIDLVFLCTPNETSLEWAPAFLKNNISVIDVSGAFRLKKHAYPEWYGFEHSAAAWLSKSEYGLYPWQKLEPFSGGEPRLIANPGCYPTAVLMAAIPLLRSGLIREDSLFIDAKSGVTGAGRKADVKLLYSEVADEFAPYKVGRHQHWPEIVEALESHASVKVNPVFITELLPLRRGISAALFAEWKKPKTALADLEAYFREVYSGQPDVSVGTDPTLSSLRAVVNTNRVHIQINEAFGRPLVFSVIDNLLRGAAGQALMNANQLAGLPAHTGLA
jgi:N-acetyl-gamma-glutamyl-phosphate reductase